jgi:hypothetical protein
MNHYHSAVQQAARMLGHIDRWLDAAVAHAQARSFDPETLLHARLAPDQFALVRQIQSACDSAKQLAAKLAGKTAPAHPDTETTLAEVRARIATVVAYLGTFTEADFAGADSAKATFRWLPGKYLDAAVYAHGYELPNFYFHVSHTYAILRHNGVVLGKRDFLGTDLPFHDL